MHIGLIGVGRMGKALAGKLVDHVILCIYDRDSGKMEALANELNVSTAKDMEQIAALGTVILAVPDREVIDCIKAFNNMPHPLTIINVATNVKQQTLEENAASHLKCIGVKFVGHAGEMLLGQRPVIIVDERLPDLVPQVEELFQMVGQVIVGNSDIVSEINTIAAEHVLAAGVHIEANLRQQNITDPLIIKSAIRQVAAGTLKAYADGNLGPFAKEIVQTIREKLKTYEM